MDFASSSLLDSSQCEFDVFVSFRGKNTRTGFTAHLLVYLRQRGINVFSDSKLLRGDDLSVLFEKIKQSKMSIVVFSENYANSSWCLEELRMIMKCRETSGHGVIPIFYNVNKSDVENQKGSFGAPFQSPEESFGPFGEDQCKIDEWKEALKVASNIAGRVYSKDRY